MQLGLHILLPTTAAVLLDNGGCIGEGPSSLLHIGLQKLRMKMAGQPCDLQFYRQPLRPSLVLVLEMPLITRIWSGRDSFCTEGNDRKQIQGVFGLMMKGKK
ncbi:hypothetical protein J5N97_003222 [Dioscorea zingiberensis]|uniref:Uncharacterized protein n=1 Tax=Dioscorea zingiberensis TaxID=325984 RepID=A0A9D5D493_9LILI|nr:hypothetical protein J5N97_003222 [Dioscorea zingiberensis]